MNTFEIGKVIDKNGDIIPKDFQSNEHHNIGNTVSDFEIIKFIGKGEFGKVYKVQSKINKQIYAMKIFDKDIEKIETKIKFFENGLTHPNIIKTYAYFKQMKDGEQGEKKQKLYLIMEYMNNGNLKDFITMNNSSEVANYLPKNQILCFLLQTIRPLYDLHKKGYILGNLKPENILIDENLKIKFGEFYSTISKVGQERREAEKHFDKIETNDESIKQIWKMKKKYISKILKGKDADVYTLGKILDDLLEKDIEDGEIKNIIKEMCVENNEGKKSEDKISIIFQEISEIYCRNQKNSSIDSMILCLKSFQKWSDLLMNKNFETKNNVLICLIGLLNFINESKSNFNYWNYYINSLRITLLDECQNLEEIEELEPNEVFLYLINIIINEVRLNSCTYNFLNVETHGDEFKYIIENPLVKNISGLIRIKLTCKKCNLTKYQFENYVLLELDPIKLNIEKSGDKIDFQNILKILIEQKEEDAEKNSYIKNLPCNQCFQTTEHKCIKEIYSLPDSLVISIKENITRNNDYVTIDNEIELEEKAKNTKKKYELVALLKASNKTNNKNNPLFYCFSKFKGKWFLSQRYKGIEQVEMNEWHRRSKNVKMIFYQSKSG